VDVDMKLFSLSMNLVLHQHILPGQVWARGSKVIAEHFSKICIYHENTKAGKHENAPSFFLSTRDRSFWVPHGPGFVLWNKNPATDCTGSEYVQNG
jgi:hypothetical protein